MYDGVGLDTFEAGLDSLRPRGTFVLVGATSGPAPAFNPQSLAARGSLFLTRPTLVDHATDPAELRDRAAELFDWVRTGAVEVSIGGRYTFGRTPGPHGPSVPTHNGQAAPHPCLSGVGPGFHPGPGIHDPVPMA